MNNDILLMVFGNDPMYPWGDSGEELGCTQPLCLNPQVGRGSAEPLPVSQAGAASKLPQQD